MSSSSTSSGKSASPKVKSLAHNLATLYIVSVVVGFSICASLLYFRLVQQLKDYADDQLQSEITSVRAMLFTPEGLRVLKEVMSFEEKGEEPTNHCILMRILDRDGNLVIDCPNMRTPLPSSVFPPPGDTRMKKVEAEGRTYLVRSAKLLDAVSQEKGWRLQVAIDLSDQKKLAVTYRNYLLLFTFAAFLLALPSSFFVVTRGLKPLNELCDSIRGITTCSRLNTRLDVTRFPTEMHAVVESVNGMMAALEDSFQRLSHYSGNLAHELRTPINNMMLEAEIALSQSRTPEEYQDLISSSLAEYERLAAVIDKLLFLARADNENNDMVYERLDARTEVEEVVDYFSDEANSAGVTLQCRADAVFWADRTLFRRALSNLISNALTYTPSGGEVVISSSCGSAGEVEITVTDTGCGIYSEHLPFLFDRFYRVRSGSNHNGAGLGLAIVKAIMLMHNGDVSAWSQPGHGTAVTLRFLHHPSLKPDQEGDA